jgi:hypothetical protein
MSSNSRYLEIDSTYRDRTRFPNPSYFEVPISINGRKDGASAVDPVCISTPIMSWTCNNLSTSNIAVNRLICTVQAKTALLTGTSDTQTFIITSASRLHQLENYYSGLIIEDAGFFNRRRIKTYKYLGSYPLYDRAQITVYNPFPETFVPTNQFYIYDPSDISNRDYPVIFVPCGSQLENGYNNFLLYNETVNEYRKIEYYDNKINCVYLVTTDSNGPVDTWSITDNFSIRSETPFLPVNKDLNPIVTGSTINSLQINVDLAVIEKLSNKFVRIVYDIYNYTEGKIIHPGNQCRRIIAYDEDTNVVTVFPNFESVPIAGTKIELINISYDNLNPFVFTGSLLSQQELVCYELELLTLILPTEILKASYGGPITYHQFVYVELSNTCSSGTRNIIYSNNPNATRAIFKVPLFDIQDTPYFIKVGGGMSQTIKFKPNDTLLFSVTLANGQQFKTIVDEQFSPSAPEPRIQLSAMFGLRRIL